MGVIIYIKKTYLFSSILPFDEQPFVGVLFDKIKGDRDVCKLAELALERACFEEGTGSGLRTALHFIN